MQVRQLTSVIRNDLKCFVEEFRWKLMTKSELAYDEYEKSLIKFLEAYMEVIAHGREDNLETDLLEMIEEIKEINERGE